VGTFIKELPEEPTEDKDKSIWPVKIILPPNKSRLLFFKT